MIVKTTLELPEPLFRQVKAAAVHCQITMKAFFNEALKEKLFRESRAALPWHESPMPPAPKVPAKELSKIHRQLLADVSEIHPEDWQ